MDHFILVLAIGLVVVAVGGWLWRRWRLAQLQALQQLALLEFPESRAALQQQLPIAAEATGKPRGLHWLQCELQPGELFAVDPAAGELYALVGTTVSFEAIPGGGMEDVEAVGNLRSATAVFVYRQRAWTTDGRVIFNLEPEQALEQSGLVRVE